MAACPRCGCTCRVFAHRAARCSQCFTSFRADAPEACLTPAERTRPDRLFEPVDVLPGQTSMETDS